MNRKEEVLREVYDSLHASAQTRQEVLSMKETNERRHFAGKRVLVAAIAVVLIMALAVGAMAAAGVFNMRFREAEPEERFSGPAGTDERGNPFTYYWEGAKLVFNFDGPSECSRIHFKPTYLPYHADATFSNKEDDGWYTRISCEGSGGGGKSNQPCLIEVRYAPMFTDDGNLLLLYADDVNDMIEEEWNGCRILKFQTQMENKNLPAGENIIECSYYIMYQPEQGYVITVSSMEDNLGELEQIAKGLEIEKTNEIISSTDYHEHNEFMDSGIG